MAQKKTVALMFQNRRSTVFFCYVYYFEIPHFS
jgi:hypothetical protein